MSNEFWVEAVPFWHSLGKAKTGTPYVEVKFKVTEECPLTGKVAPWFGSLKEGMGMEITFKSLIKLGFTSPSLSALQNSDVFALTSVPVRVKIEEADGKFKVVSIAVEKERPVVDVSEIDSF